MSESPATGRPVAVLVPTWDGWPMLSKCLVSLEQQQRRPDVVLVVDNGSIDGTVEQLRASWPEVQVLALASNRGFAGGCNRGFEALPVGFDVVLLNNDAVPEREWLAELVRARDAAPADVGILASKILTADGRLETTGDYLTRWGVPVQRGHGETDEGQYDHDIDVFAACAGASLVRREVLDVVGGFDESFFAYYEDIDLSFRARHAGYQIRFVPAARVRHVGGGTSRRVRGFKRFYATRNLWWLLLKDLPPGLLLPLLVRSAALQLTWLAGAVRHRELAIALRAHLQALRRLRELLRARRTRQFMAASEVRRYLR